MKMEKEPKINFNEEEFLKESDLTLFNEKAFIKLLDLIEVRREDDNHIVTYLGGKKSAVWRHKSLKYTIPDFKNLALKFLKETKKHINIRYCFYIFKNGIQDIRFYDSNPFKVNNSIFLKSVCLLNSTDGKRNMKTVFGLFKTSYKNGLIISKKSFRNVRHIQNEKLDNFLKLDFSESESCFKNISSILKNAKNKKINFIILRDMLVDKEGKNSKKFVSFVGKLLTSKKYKIKNISSDDIISLLAVKSLMEKKDFTYREFIEKTDKVNIEISSDAILDCYNELFRTSDLGILIKESTRILEKIS